MIKFENVSVTYPGGVKALKDLNLKINEGDFLIIVGLSGAGKSTLLRMIAGLEDANEGNILIDGKKVNSLEPMERNIAMVFQNYALYPHKTVYQNLSIGLKLKKMSKAEIDSKVMDVSS